MKNKENKHIENLVENLVTESGLESPSVNFTANVMSEVLSAQKSKSWVYKPVISKKAWFIIFASLLALFAFLLLNMKTTTSKINFDLSIFGFDKWFNSFSGLPVSPLTGNVLLAATLMLFVQIFLLKSYFNKKFEK
jgi:hypothetical protein